MEQYILKDWLLKNVREIGAYKAVLLVDILKAPIFTCEDPQTEIAVKKKTKK